jgi:hypothetical protein
MPVMRIARVVLMLAIAGCGSGAANSPSRNLPPYRGEAVDVFDDAIEPHAVGLELEARMDPRVDLKLRMRAQTADMVVRAQVSTVTNEVQGPDQGFQIGFRVLQRLAGAASTGTGDEFTVRVDRSSPSIGIVRSFEGRLVGKTLVMFVKAFTREGGERDLHFHGSTDAPDTIAAVHEAVVLDELK